MPAIAEPATSGQCLDVVVAAASDALVGVRPQRAQPGVSMTHAPPGRRCSERDVVVCLPRPSFDLTAPVSWTGAPSSVLVKGRTFPRRTSPEHERPAAHAVRCKRAGRRRLPSHSPRRPRRWGERGLEAAPGAAATTLPSASRCPPSSARPPAPHRRRARAQDNARGAGG
jgi:hypothetical protein